MINSKLKHKLTKIKIDFCPFALSFRGLVEEAQETLAADSQNKDVSMVTSVLQVCQDILKHNPDQLPTQLLCRINPGTSPVWNSKL